MALLAMAAWQRRPGWVALAFVAAGTLGSVATNRSIRAPRWIATGASVLLAMALTLAVGDTRTLDTVTRDWREWSSAEREARATRVAASLTSTASALTAAAQRIAQDTALLSTLGAGVLDATTEASTATAVLSPPLAGRTESAILVFRGSALMARAGQLRTTVAARGQPGIRLVDEPFYSSLEARAISPNGADQVVTVALIAARPPADHFARALIESTGRTDLSSTIVESPDSSRVEEGTTVIVVPDGPRRLARVRALARTDGEAQLELLQRARARTAVPVVLAALLVLAVSWRRPARTVHRMAVTLVLLLAVAVAPLSALSNVSPLFDASSYYVRMAGPLTANVAALLLTAALGLAMLFLILRSGRVVRITSAKALASLMVIVSATLGPFVLRDLSRGIALPADGVSIELWIAWQLAIALAGASVLHVGAAAGQTILGGRRGLPGVAAPSMAIVAALLAPNLWQSPGGWPGWYPVLWALAILALAFTRRGVALVTGAAIIAGTGAVTLTWGATVRARMSLAQHDLARLSAVDENAYRLLERFALTIAGDPRGVAQSDGLLRRFAASELAQAGYPTRMARWDSLPAPTPMSELRLAPLTDSIGAQSVIASMARESGAVEIRAVEDGPTTVLIAAIPAPDHTVTTVAVPPRTRLLPSDPFALLTGLAGTRGGEPPYRLTLSAATPLDSTSRPLVWRRRGDTMHGDGVASGGLESRLIHVEVDLRSLDVLAPRGALLVLLDVAVVLVLWGTSAMADGAFGRWLRVRRARLARSYRVRLSAALLASFLAPAAVFAGWSWYRLQDDDRASRELLVREALRTAASDVARRDLATTASSVGSPLFLYRSGQLLTASDTLLSSLAPLGRLLPLTNDESDFASDDVFATRRVPVGNSQALVGFRRVAAIAEGLVVVTPARGDEFALDERRADLGVLLLFTASLGALAAFWLSGVAARSLARPVGALREAALSIAAGRDATALGSAPATEFAPVYRAFGRMSEDLTTSRAALEAAQRRTAAVLQHVASGVVAFDRDGAVTIANPRAEEILAASLPPGTASLDSLPAECAPIVVRCRTFLAHDNDEDAFDHQWRGRQLRGRLTRLPGGAVLTLDDVTELASAQRVLAWGEMARQVAHEIKNPLTPIRLGVQHLRRAYRDGRPEFGDILDTNVTRVLSEIDRLDEIARAFSRYGTAPDQRAPAVQVDVRAVAHDVLELERLGESGVQWQFDAPDDTESVFALGQRDELKEVLLNLLENARLAHSHVVRVSVLRDGETAVIEVRDDGQGIAPDVLPHVFEPHFSTRTSGSGLGLAISRRLIEGWGGRITLESVPGAGTCVRVSLKIG